MSGPTFWRMTTREQLPIEATEEPQIQSPAQEAERARKATALSAALEHEGDPLTLADADNPLRMPGEMTARPRSAVPSAFPARPTPSGKKP